MGEGASRSKAAMQKKWTPKLDEASQHGWCRSEGELMIPVPRRDAKNRLCFRLTPSDGVWHHPERRSGDHTTPWCGAR